MERESSIVEITDMAKSSPADVSVEDGKENERTIDVYFVLEYHDVF